MNYAYSKSGQKKKPSLWLLILSFLTSVFLPHSAKAEPTSQIIVLQAGATAPFDGQLLTNDAAAKLLKAKEKAEEATKIKVGVWKQKYELSERNADLRVSILQDALDRTSNSLTRAYEDKDPFYKSWAFAFTVGVMFGLAATYISAMPQASP